MARCKKIIEVAILVIIVFSMHSCKVKAPINVSLYLDNSKPIEDAHELSETLFLLNDVDSLQILDSTVTEVYSTTKDVLQIGQLTPDTSTLNKINIENRAIDSTNLAELRQLLQLKNDSINLLNKRISNLEKLKTASSDTVYIQKEVIKTLPADNFEHNNDDEISDRLVAQSDSIKLLQNQIIALQKQKARDPDTVYIEKEIINTIPADNFEYDRDNKTSARFVEQSESIKLLQNQIIALQKQTATVPDTVYLKNEVIKTMAADNSKNNNVLETSAGLVVQSDSIKLLQNQIIALQKQKVTAPDSVYIEKEGIKTVPADNKELSKIDSIPIVAYYQMGNITPVGGDSILNKLNDLISTKKVLKITISGYTDSSGNRNINKAITSKRILYFVERLTPVFPVENIYSQNFGDTFASDSILENERRLVFSVILLK